MKSIEKALLILMTAGLFLPGRADEIQAVHSLKGHQEEGRFIYYINEEKVGTSVCRWALDGTITCESQVSLAGQTMSSSLAVKVDQDGFWTEITARTPYKKENLELQARFYARRGYVFAAQDVRGRFSSPGEWRPLIHEADDGYETIEWLASRPWANGNVGMIGASYLGWVQWLAASRRPPHLKAMIPNVSPPEAYFNFPHENGALMLATSLWWSNMVERNATSDITGFAFQESLSVLDQKKLMRLPAKFTYDPADPTGPNPEGRTDVLIYQTPVADKPLTIAGPVSAVLYASTSAMDTDWVMRLARIDRDGHPLPLAEGITRARYRESFSHPQLLEPGKIYEYRLDLWQTGITIKPGERLMLVVCSALFPKFSRNLNTGGHNELESRFLKADQIVYHGRSHPSHVLLPILNMEEQKKRPTGNEKEK